MKSASVPCSSLIGVFLPESFQADAGINSWRCPGCGENPHKGGVAVCPQVSAIVYDAQGNLKEIHKK